MPRRRDNRQRKLWIRIRVKGKTSPLNIPFNEIRDTLIESIERGDYRYPENWYVEIQWRNKDLAPMKTGEFTAEMLASLRSSVGWDYAILNYLRSK